MTTFDLAEVREFAAELDARMDRCDNGEGMECATLDSALSRYADICCEFREEVREWARAVFTGRVDYCLEVERAWLHEGYLLLNRATAMWSHGQNSEGQCFILEGRIFLQAALWGLYRLLSGWVTPKLAVSPLARRVPVSSSLDIDEIHKRIAALPPLPANWQPDHPSQRALYRKIHKNLAETTTLADDRS
jgi:hypothetical protein